MTWPQFSHHLKKAGALLVKPWIREFDTLLLVAGIDGRPAPIVQRDVTPHNVLLPWRGLVQLTEFRLALAVDRTQDTPDAGTVKDHNHRRNPEQSPVPPNIPA